MTRSRAFSPQAQTLLAILAAAQGEWRHGYDLVQATGLRSGTLYPLLIRLEAQGLLEAEWQPPAAPGRPPRHAYRLTAAGLARARSGDEAGTDQAGPPVAKRGEAFT